ncbi:PREDICTED: cullin-9-like [Calidris pugnax]|nr:PREDICTED: cullin-9-like [Calidris pugnax]
MVNKRHNGNLLVHLGPKLQAYPEELLRQRRGHDGQPEYLIQWSIVSLEEKTVGSSSASSAETKPENISMWMSAEEVCASCPALLGKRKLEGQWVKEEKAASPLAVPLDEASLLEMKADVRSLVQRAGRQMAETGAPESSILNTIHVLSAYASIGLLAGAFKETGALDLLMKMLCHKEKQIRRSAGKMLRALASHDAGSRAYVLLSLSQQDGIEQHVDFDGRYTLLELFAEMMSSEEHCMSFEGIHLPQIPGKLLFVLVKHYLCVTSLMDKLCSGVEPGGEQQDCAVPNLLAEERSRAKQEFEFSMAMANLILELAHVMGWDHSPKAELPPRGELRPRAPHSIFQHKTPACPTAQMPVLASNQGPHRKQGRVFLTPSDFADRSGYVEYLQANLVRGMRVRLLEDCGDVRAGEEGEFLQSTNSMHTVQVQDLEPDEVHMGLLLQLAQVPLDGIPSPSLYWYRGVVLNQVQDLEPDEVHMGLLLQLAQVPLDGIPSPRIASRSICSMIFSGTEVRLTGAFPVMVNKRHNGNLLVHLGPKLQAYPEELLRQRRGHDGQPEYLIQWSIVSLEEKTVGSSSASSAETKPENISMWMSAEEVCASCPALLGKRKLEGQWVKEEKAASPLAVPLDEASLLEMKADVRSLVQRAGRQMAETGAPESSILNTIHVLSAYASIGLLAGAFKETGALDLLMKMLCHKEKQIRRSAGKMLRALASHDAGSRAYVLLSLSQQDGIEQHVDFDGRYTLLELFAEMMSSEEHCMSFEGIHLPQIPGKLLFVLVKHYLCVTSLMDKLCSGVEPGGEQQDCAVPNLLAEERSRAKQEFEFSMAMANLILELAHVMGWDHSPKAELPPRGELRPRAPHSIFQHKTPACPTAQMPVLASNQGPHRKQGRVFLTPSDFADRSGYVEYLQANLVRGMRVRLLEDCGDVRAGEEGEFLQSTNSMHTVQVLWQSTGQTCWMRWHMLEIIDFGDQWEDAAAQEKEYSLIENVNLDTVGQPFFCKPFGGLYSLPYLGEQPTKAAGALSRAEWWELLFFVKKLEAQEQKEITYLIQQDQGGQVQRFLEAAGQAPDLVERYCGLYQRLRGATEELFGQQAAFVLALGQGFAGALLQLSFLATLHVSEQFARYLDGQIQELHGAGGSAGPLQRLQQILEPFVVFSGLELAHTFEHFYRHYLGDRLLAQGPSWLEGAIVEQIGLCFPSRFPQQMLSNLAESEELQQQFHLFQLQEQDRRLLELEPGLEEAPAPVADVPEVKVLALSPRCWPVSPFCYMEDPGRFFPAALSSPLEEFAEFCRRSQSQLGWECRKPRRLQWTWLGRAELQFGDCVLQVSTLQMYILLCFNSAEEVAVEALLQATGLPADLVHHALTPLTHGEGILVWRCPPGAPGVLRLNQAALAHASGRPLRLLPRQRYLRAERAEVSALERKRNVLCCLITRILKAEKQLHIDNLVFRVIDACQKGQLGPGLQFLSFCCHSVDVLSCVLHLLNQGYLRRQEERPHVLEYISAEPTTPLGGQAQMVFQGRPPEASLDEDSTDSLYWLNPGISRSEEFLMAMLQVPMGHTLSPEEVKLLMNQTVQQVQDTLSIPNDVAQHLLMHCRWNVDFLIQCYVENRETLLISSGLQVRDVQPALSPGAHCPVCVNQLCPTEKPPTLCCMHYCCKPCWREYLTTRIEQNMVVNCTCPISDCRAQPTTAFIYSIISSEEIIAKYEKALLRGYVECCSNLTWCTNPQGCDQILLKDGFGYGAACSKCSWISCFNCNFPEAHYPASCSHMSQWVDDDGYYEGMTTEAQSKHLAKLISKHCPSCQAQIEKNEGCLHMTCAKCNHGFCWRCLKPWKPTHKDYYNCSAMVSKAAWQEKRFQDYNERCTFHHHAREFATSLRKRVSSISEMPKIRTLTFVLDACKALEQARKVLAYSCVYSYYNQDTESMDIVEQQTESLELHTNALQILLEETLLQYQDLASSLQLLKAEHFSAGLELVHQIKRRLFAILWHSTQDFHVGLQTLADPAQKKVKLSNVPTSAPACVGLKRSVLCDSPNAEEGGKEGEDEEYEPQWQEDYDDDDDLDEDNFLFDDESDNLDCDSYFDDDDAYD